MEIRKSQQVADRRVSFIERGLWRKATEVAVTYAAYYSLLKHVLDGHCTGAKFWCGAPWQLPARLHVEVAVDDKWQSYLSSWL